MNSVLFSKSCSPLELNLLWKNIIGNSQQAGVKKKSLINDKLLIKGLWVNRYIFPYLNSQISSFSIWFWIAFFCLELKITDLFYRLGENKHKWKVNKRLKTSLHVRTSTTIRAIQQFRLFVYCTQADKLMNSKSFWEEDYSQMPQLYFYYVNVCWHKVAQISENCITLVIPTALP